MNCESLLFCQLFQKVKNDLYYKGFSVLIDNLVTFYMVLIVQHCSLKFPFIEGTLLQMCFGSDSASAAVLIIQYISSIEHLIFKSLAGGS